MSNPMTCSQGRAGQDRTGTQQKGYTKTQTHINTQTKTQAQATLGTGTGSWDSTEVAGGGGLPDSHCAGVWGMAASCVAATACKRQDTQTPVVHPAAA